MKKCISVEHVPNRYVRVYRTPCRISIDRKIQSFSQPPDEHKMERIGAIGKEIIEDLANRERIKGIRIQPFEIRVEVEDDFDWGCVQPLIVIVLKRVLFKYSNIQPNKVVFHEEFKWETLVEV